MKQSTKRKPIPKRDRVAERAVLKEALRTGQSNAADNEGYKVLNTAEIFTDERYQRPINEAKIGRILKNYDENLVNPPKVSYRDGRYWVFDGQHTLTAAKIHNGGDTNILCKVYKGLTFEQEVSLFIQQTGESSRVSIGEKLHAMLSAGDHDVTEMDRAVKDAGLAVSYHNSGSGVTGTIVAVSALWKAYKRLGILTFATMLEDIRAAWGGEYDSLRGEILTGMSKFYAAYMGDFKQDTLIKKLSNTPPASIIREGKLAGIGASTGTSYARVILQIYNRGLQKKLEDRL